MKGSARTYLTFESSLQLLLLVLDGPLPVLLGLPVQVLPPQSNLSTELNTNTHNQVSSTTRPKGKTHKYITVLILIHAVNNMIKVR